MAESPELTKIGLGVFLIISISALGLSPHNPAKAESEIVDIEFEDVVGPVQLITCNPEVLVYTHECDPAAHQWLKSKGVDITATPDGFLDITSISGTWSTGNIIGYSSELDAPDSYGGINEGEVVTVSVLNAAAKSVNITFATLPDEVHDEPSTVVLKAYDSENNLVAAKTETFKVISGGSYNPATVGIQSSNHDISYVTIEAIEYPFMGVWIKSISLDRIPFEEIPDLPPAITTPLPTDIVTMYGEGFEDGESFEYFDEVWMRAYDDHDGAIPLSCDPPSGALMHTGLTMITCIATDSKGQESQAWFYVRLVDALVPESSDPVLSCRINNENGPILDGSSSVPIGSELFCATISIRAEAYHFNRITVRDQNDHIVGETGTVQGHINSLRFNVDSPGRYEIKAEFMAAADKPASENARISFSSSDRDSSLTVRTDKTSYQIGDDVTITGSVSDFQDDLPVTIRVSNPDGALVRVDQVTVESDGKYSYTFPIGGILFEPNKSYTVTASYGDLTANTTFRIDKSSNANCFGQVPTILGTERNDVLTGTSGADVIVGLRGNDVINALGGDDVICGGLGLDEISGGPGNDEIFGGNGNDAISGNSGYDSLWGGQGWDRLFGGLGKDVLHGGVGNDALEGGDGIDKLYGGEGDDTLDGVPEDKNPGQDFDIIIEIDDTEPDPGNTITISGRIYGADHDDVVDMTIRAPDGEIDNIDALLDHNREFDESYDVPDPTDEGIYEIEVEFGSEEPVFAYFLIDEEADEVEVSTDEDTYEPGDDVEIIGVVDDPITGVNTVEIRVLTPAGEDIGPGEVDIDGSDEFEETVNLDNNARPGIYAVIVEYDEVETGWFLFEVD